MANDARNTRKTTEDESSGSRKKPSSSVSGSGSVSGEASGLRRSTRSQSNSSPGSVRKSQRLEKRGPETATPTLPRRSARENKFESSGKSVSNKGGKQQTGKGGSRTPETSKKLAEEVELKAKRDSSPSVGEKRKKRLDARRFKALFDSVTTKVSAETSLETESKKRRLDTCYGNEDSCSGEPGEAEGISEISEKGVGNSHLKLEEGLQVNGNDRGGGVCGNADEGLEEKCVEEAGRDVEDPEEEPQECSDGEEMEGVCATNVDVGTTGLCVEKPCELKDGEGQQVSRDPNLSSQSTPGTMAEKNSVQGVVGEVCDSMVEQLPNQEIPSASGGQGDISNGSICNQKALTVGASVVGGESARTNMTVFPSVSPTCTTSSLNEECAKCSKGPRSDHNSSKHESCGCLLNSMSNANIVSVSKDRGERCNAAEEDGKKKNISDPLVDADQGSCVICKHAGKLLCCSGKACHRGYHPSCLRTREEKLCTSIWYCSECVKKKLVHGVHSVSEGIESILDSRVVELSNSEGSLTEKQYFVKYKGLAHIHNCWITETRLLNEAPELHLKLNEQDLSWKPEWAVPHRLLLRRSIVVDKQDSGSESKSHHEWLVKWLGLDYDQATWELEESEFFKKPEVQQLLKEYESRHNEARHSVISGDNKFQERRKIPYVKHGKISDILRFEAGNKLREFYQKGHNVMLLDEQDRAMKIIYFISSILSNVHRPFLIVTPQETLSYWEAEFLRFTSPINVVVYGGNSDSRKIIRSLEFDGESGELMLQVLLSSVEAISEDLEEIKGMEWEAIIVDDDCQENCILRSSGCIKTLGTSWKLLLLNAQLKDNVVDYINILSLLEPCGSSNQYHRVIDDSNNDINLLKERLCSFIISPRFQEYWVPVEISNVQLEQYCSSMLSNSTVLWSCSKSDPIGSLHAVLTSTQKCCDHPYIVNPSLRKLLLPEEPPQDAALDMGVKASGKLQLLDKILSDFRNHGLKVLIVFQSIGGYGKDNLEIILEDFLTWRFGEDSYEQVAAGVQPGKRQAALNKFNRERDKSFLLLETRACSPSIKLSFVDSVILLNSDWNPLNDLRALQKIVIDSKLKPINVFRFYCSFTVEEKALIIAKNDAIADGSQQISPSTKQLLLMWGSSYLFSRLDKFHRDKVLHCKDNIALESSFVTDVCQEVVSLVRNQGNMNPHRYISLARQDGGCYGTNTQLFGEQRTQLEDGVSSHTFWMKLLEGKQPQWKYLSGSSERNRKRVHYSNELSSPRNVQADELAKKRKDLSPRIAQNPVKPKDSVKEHHGHFDLSNVQQDDRRDLHYQRSLFDILKPTVLRLCETLMMKDEVKRLAESFLEFVLNNNQVTREPETILQAFQISVCWTAAEVLGKQIEHKKSLEVVRGKMDFKCLEQEADSVYTKMKVLMKTFLSRNLKFQKSSIDLDTATPDSTMVSNGNCVPVSPRRLEKLTVGSEKGSFAAECSNKAVTQPLQTTSIENDSLGSTEKLQKKCEKMFKRLKEKHDEEVINFEKTWEKKRVELEKNYKLESAVIRYSHAKSTAGVDKLKILENDYATKKEDLESQISSSRKELDARLQEERDGEQKKIAHLWELVKPVVQDELSEKPPSSNSIQLQRTEDIGLCKDSSENVSVTERLTKERNSGEVCGTRLPAVLSCNVQNTLSTGISFPVSENQRAGCEYNSPHPLEKVSACAGAAIGNLAGDKNLSQGLSSRSVVEPVPGSSQQDSAAEQHSEPAAERKEDTTQTENDQGNGEQFLPQVSTFINQQTADGSSCQGLGDELCQRQVEGVPPLVRLPSEIRGTSPGLETSSVDPVNPDRDNLPQDEGTSAVYSTERSFPVSVGYCQTSVASSGQLCSQRYGVQMAAQSSRIQMQQQHVPQSGAYVSGATGPSVARTIQSNPGTNSRVSASYHSDPLQNEYDRLRKNIADAINAHEEMKLRLKSECDKEIEEVVAEIRRKYDAKLDEAESSFSLKKNELESNQNMVMMNKFLADAFRSKCMDYKAGPQAGIPKGLASSPADLHFQLQPTTRPFSPDGSLSVVQTAAGPNNAPSLVPSRRPPVNSSSGRFQQARHEIRAAAPHLQHISASSPLTSSNMQFSDVSPLQPTNKNLGSSSSLQIPARPSQSQQPTSHLLMFQSTHGQSNQAETFGKESAFNRSLSATELLSDIARQNDAEMLRLSRNLPPLPENIQTQNSCDLSQFGRAVGVQQRADDLVCLSDDD